MKKKEILQRLRLISDLFRVDGTDLRLIEVAIARLQLDLEEATFDEKDETVTFLFGQTIRSRARTSLFFELKEHCEKQGGLLTLKELEEFEKLDRKRRFGS